ncbi:MAG: transcription-repair coupling factor [bacterium]|jgi:transcription-repair coupling factor (superfamily II helicase)
MKKLTNALTPLQRLEEFKKIVNNLQEGIKWQLVYGLGGSQKTYMAAGLWSVLNRTCLYITANLRQAHAVYDDLLNFLPADCLYVFPGREILPYDFEAQSIEIVVQRLAVLQRLLAGKKQLFVIAPVTALERALPPPESLQKAGEEIKVGKVIERDYLLEKLVWLGYEPGELVEGKGQFAVRGSIIDFFPLTSANPYRIEFFDNEIDSIREFAIESQRSQQKLEQVFIFSAREMVLTNREREQGIERFRQRGIEEYSRLEAKGQASLAKKLKQRWEHYLEQAEGSVYFPGIEHLQPLFYGQKCSLFEYFPRQAVVFLDEPLSLQQKVEDSFNQLTELHANLLAEGQCFSFQMDSYFSWGDLTERLGKRPAIALSLFAQDYKAKNSDIIISLTAKDVPGYQGKRELVVTDLKRWLRQRYTVFIFASTPERKAYLKEYLADGGVESTLVSNDNFTPPAHGVYIYTGVINKGFEFPQLKAVLLTEKDIIGQQKVRPLSRSGHKGREIRSLTDLTVGELVVHVNHGIGRYLGINTLEVDGAQRDYLLVQYAGEDRLYVPTDQLQLLQKYIGVEGQKPKLNKLGGNEWNRVKSRVKKSVQELAQGLLKLYALRETVQGFAFSPDTVWQKEFEDSFPYEETEDQKEAINRVKQLMEEKKPMDHLVCGDVGYGKTEVAVRAAFKAVMDGKQVAILVPTTILAQQHYHTFQGRFAPYPVKIEQLSRFRTPAEQRAVLQGLRRGSVDIVIGTHRLLQPDVKFKDLGLLVIDEEQRFGVSQKEVLKRLRENVDVLTLTATPIPRTLHMALAGIRDMSLIETPPENRYPVQTYVLEHDYNLIRDAISQELHRKGQVFYVHNRVETIQKEAGRLQELLPEARIAIGHGQMGERELEEVIRRFLLREYDLLVCTTIIENGLDMPNVNTLIVTEADKMGLAQLYQLRGRVGRSERIAYAYFTYKKNKVLSTVAQKRLQALREFTELGSGFKLALRDLEIRGAGNLLGAEQHGYIANIGFELYCTLLAESVKELKGEVREVEPEPSLDLNISAYLPGNYIADGRQKVEIYKAFASSKTRAEVNDLVLEIKDRFGPLPPPAQNLVQIARIKALARELGIESISQNKDKINIGFAGTPIVPMQKLFTLLRDLRRRVLVNAGGRPRIIIAMAGLEQHETLNLILQVLTKIASLAEEEGIKYNKTS